MSEERDSTASFPDEEKKKKMKMKLDIPTSSGSYSDVKEGGDGSEESAMDPSASAIVGSEGNSMENKPSYRNQDDVDFSSGSVPGSILDEDSQTKKTGSSCSSSAASASYSRKYQPSRKTNKRIVLYKKILTHDDVFKCRLMMPLESCKYFLPPPMKYDGTYDSITLTVIDHEGDVWEMEAAFEEPSSSYMLGLNWDKYLKIFELEPEDVIFFYYVPGASHYLIEYEKKGRDSNPKEDDVDLSSGLVSASIHDRDYQIKKMGSSSARGSSKDQPCSSINPGLKKRTLLYKKSLTRDDINKSRLMIPLQSGRKFLPEPKKHDGRYDQVKISFMDHNRDIWKMEASFQEKTRSYILYMNWGRYLKKYKLEPEDVIFFYDVPGSKHYSIEYERKRHHRNSKKTT